MIFKTDTAADTDLNRPVLNIWEEKALWKHFWFVYHLAEVKMSESNEKERYYLPWQQQRQTA